MSQRPIIWIVSTGTEIVQGKYADTNAQWLSRRLLELGLAVARHTAAPDDLSSLKAVFQDAAASADFIISTGGLGPTMDDLNRAVVAEIWGAPLAEDAASLRHIEARYEKRGRVMPPANRAQALMPRGARALANDWGTAPGFLIDAKPGVARAALAALPGPPREMRPMFEERLRPELEARFAAFIRPLRTLTFHTIGVPEAWVNERVADLAGADARVNLALLAGQWRVEVRLTLDGGSVEENEKLAEAWRERITTRLGAEKIYGEDGATLESAIGARLRARGQWLATAESCTGGMIAGRVTAAPGSSDYFKEGFVTYANAAKTARLGVDEATLNTHGAVSAETARAMAEGAARAAGADWALAVTGIAGPGGGSEDKPVGLVFIALAGPGVETQVLREHFLGDRDDVRSQTVSAALGMLWRALVE